MKEKVWEVEGKGWMLRKDGSEWSAENLGYVWDILEIF